MQESTVNISQFYIVKLVLNISLFNIFYVSLSIEREFKMHYKDYVPQSALLHHDSIIAITYIISLNLRFIKEIYSVRRLKKDEFS